MIVKQSADLMRFISYLSVNGSNEIVLNELDTKPNYISRFYTPKLLVSPLANRVLDIIKKTNFFETNKSLSKDTLTVKLLESDLKLMNPYIYMLTQSIVLESFALIYMLEDEPSMIKYLDKDDVETIRTNTKYVLDTLGDREDYMSIVKDLQDIEVALGYIQGQLPIIKKGLNTNDTL